jgi:hypothetical protein
MSALPSPQPQPKRKLSKKQAARAIARLLEEHMEEMGLSEEEKNAKVRALAEDVKRIKASRSALVSK